MLSFGKDSMVLAHLIRESVGHIGRFPVPVIYHRDPWFSHKHEFADHIIQSWAMEVHDYPPMHAGIKVKPDMLELVARYSFGTEAMDIPKNVCVPEEYPRREFICGLNDWLLQPKTHQIQVPWDIVFIGHKSCDVDPFEGKVPLNVDVYELGGIYLVFPLRHWTDDDIWNYIEANHIPTQKTRYQDRIEVKDKWYNNDYVHACTRCIDPRETRAEVDCPKFKHPVPNIGKAVLRLEAKPDYIERAA